MVDCEPELSVIPINAIALDLCRRAADLSQNQLAERAGVSPGYMSRILTGKQPRVSVEIMDRLLKVFGDRVTFSELRAAEHATGLTRNAG